MEEESFRKMAVEQYRQDKAPISLYQEMGRSKKWFFRWLHRYQSGDPLCYRERSRIPHSHPIQIRQDTHKLVPNIRIQLEQHPYVQAGTSSIKWEFKKLGNTPPSDRTINRILKREGLVEKISLYPHKGGGVPFVHKAPGPQQHPSNRSSWAKIYQKRWTLLFAPCHGPLQPPSLSPSPTTGLVL